eukprot:760714-Hanusia_phi.AAC.6
MKRSTLFSSAIALVCIHNIVLLECHTVHQPSLHKILRFDHKCMLQSLRGGEGDSASTTKSTRFCSYHSLSTKLNPMQTACQSETKTKTEARSAGTNGKQGGRGARFLTGWLWFALKEFAPS